MQKKWKLLIIGALIIEVIGIKYYKGYVYKPIIPIEYMDLSAEEEQYRELFYQDSTVITEGELFDIRYNYCELLNEYSLHYQIEVVKKTNIHFDEAEFYVSARGGKGFTLKSRISNEDRWNERVYNVGTIEIAINPAYYGTEEEIVQLGVEIYYKGKKENLLITYNEDKMEKVLEKYFQMYYQGEILTTEENLVAIRQYYRAYVRILKNKGIEKAREFIDTFTLYYMNDESYQGTFLLSYEWIYDYFDDSIMNEENVDENLETLRTLMGQSKEYTLRLEEAKLGDSFFSAQDLLDLIGEIYSYKDDAIMQERIQQDREKVTPDITYEEYEELINSYLYN